MSFTHWSIEQVLALAPDSSSLKAGKELAAPRNWMSLGSAEGAVWGECQGSAKEPYQTQIDLHEPAFKCSCPSRKFPCKHALGLFLLFTSQPALFRINKPPAWVTEWLEKRAQRTEQRTKPKDEAKTDAGGDEAERQAAKARRAAKREERVREGLSDFDLWLQDLFRQGLASVQSKPLSYWDTPAARLVDAQAPGLARRVRDMASIPASGEGWQGRLLEQAARLYLALGGYRRVESLPQATQDDLKALVGWTQDQDALLNNAGIRDRWLMMGKRVEEETIGALGSSSSMKVQRAWLWGEKTQRTALILHFAAPGQVLDTSLVPGALIDAEVVYFPGAYPLRALIKERQPALEPGGSLPGYSRLVDASRAYAAALAANPWLETFPMALAGMVPFQNGDTWGVRDADGRIVNIAPEFTFTWQLLALSGGNPVTIFGEWNGESYWPLSVNADGRWIIVHKAGAER